jgi:hypothetical protein
MICKPYKTASKNYIAQLFGVNPQSWQPNGHTGIDLVSENGTYLVAPELCKVERIVTDLNFNQDLTPLSRGYGILLRSLVNPNMTFLHWHCWVVFPVKEGDTVAQGQPVACMGNSGFCMVGGKVVPVELRTKQPFPGTHDHFEVRVNGEYVDPMKYIDWDIPIKYDALTTMKEILLKIFNILK